MAEITQTPPTAESKALTVDQQFKREMTQMTPQFQMVLPAHIPPEKFVRVAMTAALQNADLLKMDRKLLMQELIKCATDGLIPDGREAAILPFKGKPKYLPMIRGILKKVRNSGDLKSITPMVVYERDEFEYWIDENGPHLKHVPCFDRDPGPVRLTYAAAQTKDGGSYVEIIPESQMDKIRKSSASGNNGPWGGDFADEMRKKSALKRLEKRLPSSTDLEDIMKRDEEVTEPHDERPADPIKFETIDIPSAKETAGITQGTSAAESEPAPQEAASPAGTKQVLNHATGKPHTVATAPAKAAESVPKTNTTSGDLPDRLLLGKQIQDAFRKLGFKPVEAGEWVKNKTGKNTSELLTVEMVHVFDDLVELAIEKGITL